MILRQECPRRWACDPASAVRKNPPVPRYRKQTDELVIKIQGPLLDLLRQHHASAGLPGSMQETARDLIETALNYPRIDSTQLMTARRRAFAQVKGRAWREFANSMVQLQQLFDRELSTYPDEEPS